MLKGDRTKEIILAEALDLATVKGLEGLSIGALAAHTGLSKSGLFAHFGSKETLQLDVLKAASDRFVERVVQPTFAMTRGVDRLQALFENQLDWARKETFSGGCPFVASNIEWDDRSGPIRDYLVWAHKAWLGVVVRAVEKAKDQGDFRDKLDADRFAHDFNAIYLGYHNAQRLLRDPNAEAYARAAFARLMRDSQQS